MRSGGVAGSEPPDEVIRLVEFVRRGRILGVPAPEMARTHVLWHEVADLAAAFDQPRDEMTT